MRDLINIVENAQAGILTELFDAPLPFEWKQRSDQYWRGEFDVDGRNYSVACSKEANYYDPRIDQDLSDIWELYFIPTDNTFDTGVLGVTQPARVLATALTGFREFIEAVKPEMIQFTGDATQPSRVKLYRKMATVFAGYLEQHGYAQCEPPHHRMIDVTKGNYLTLTFTRRSKNRV
jgi:hypothetical protein